MKEKEVRDIYLWRCITRYKFCGLHIFISRIIITAIANVLDSLVYYLSEKVLLFRAVTSNANGDRMRKFHISLCLFYPNFLLLKLAPLRIARKGKRPSLFLSFPFSSTLEHSSIYWHSCM